EQAHGAVQQGHAETRLAVEQAREETKQVIEQARQESVSSAQLLRDNLTTALRSANELMLASIASLARHQDGALHELGDRVEKIGQTASADAQAAMGALSDAADHRLAALRDEQAK